MLPSMSAIAPSPAPCKRFAVALTDDGALLGADVVRYSFIAGDLHPLLLAGLPAHLCENGAKNFSVVQRVGFRGV